MTEEDKILVVAYQNCFATDAGKLVLADLKKVLNYDLSVVPRGSDGHLDIYEILRNEGKRSVVVHILKKMEIDLNAFGKQQPEIVKERNYIE